MKTKLFAAACALALAAPAMAAVCTSTSNWGDLSPPDSQPFGNAFTSVTSFNDCYNFSLASGTDASGVTGLFDLSSRLNIALNSVSLYTGSSLVQSDSTAESFMFSNLGVGSYRLEVAGNVVPDGGRITGLVFYTGTINTVAAPVPEPEAYAMMLAGFVGVGFGVLRRKKA